MQLDASDDLRRRAGAEALDIVVATAAGQDLRRKTDGGESKEGHLALEIYSEEKLTGDESYQYLSFYACWRRRGWSPRIACALRTHAWRMLITWTMARQIFSSIAARERVSAGTIRWFALDRTEARHSPALRAEG